jgi:deoxyribonuclease-4
MTQTKKKPKRATSPPVRLLGAHMSTAGGFDQAVDRALSIGCTAMQIFVKSNMQWFARAPISDGEAKLFREKVAKLRIAFAHSGYMINLAATNPDFLARSRQALRDELIRADQLGLPFLVLHPGAHMGAGVAEGLARVIESLDLVFAEIPKVKTKVALECTAGQGTALGAEFGHLAAILKHVRQRKRLCVCLDTAHLFAAGYDISSYNKAAAVMHEFDRIVGLKHLAAIHLNDSKAALGSRVDRHEHIGKGKIGCEGFRYFMNAPELAAIPKVLETPKEKDLKEDVMNLEVLCGLCSPVLPADLRSTIKRRARSQ